MPCEDCTCGAAEVDRNAPLGWNDYPEGTFREGFRSFTAPKAEGTVQETKTNGVGAAVPLRSKQWFDDPGDPGMAALYTERYLNDGRTMDELVPHDRPVIGIAQTGSDLAPCNQHHVELAKRVREGIVAAGGTALEFPCHPIQESSKRPTASLDRNLAYIGLVEVLFGYPLDGVVLLTGCDKTTPALLMGAATMNIPAICMNVGPMLNGYRGPDLAGSGAVLWDGRADYAAGRIDGAEFKRRVGLSAPSTGHCNTFGTASTMNALAEALGMALPGSASIPAVYRERKACAYATGKRIVQMVREDLKPSDIMTKKAFENAIAVNTVIGGSTNATIHLNAVAKHIGVELDCDDWERVGYDLPLLVNVKPAGAWLCEEYHRAGGLPSVIAEMLKHSALPHPDVITCTGKSMDKNCREDFSQDTRVIVPWDKPLKTKAGFLHLKGNLFDSAIMKTSVISDAFIEQYLSKPHDPMAFEGPVAVFDGPEDYHSRIEKSDDIDKGTILVMRGAGPKGYPGAAEVVNMIPPGRLIRQGVELPCIGDGRQSGTSGTPSILHASPEAASGGTLSILEDGDIIRIDLNKRTADVKLSLEEISRRQAVRGEYPIPPSQTPWQAIYRANVGELSDGMVFKEAVGFQRLAQTQRVPRPNH